MALFRRALLDHGVYIISSRKHGSSKAPMWSARNGAEIKSFRSIMSADRGFKAFKNVGDKEKTKRILSEAGIQTPVGIPVDRENLEESWLQYQQSVGARAVVKPKAGSHGRGITMGVESFSDFVDAISTINGDALLEKELVGNDYRVVTIGNDVVACTQRLPANVCGNGVDTIRKLIAEKNKRRALNPSTCRYLLTITDETIRFLERQGYDIDDVPVEGEVVNLVAVANLGAGGDAINRTLEIHSGFVEICASLPNLFGDPEILGIDILAEDISTEPEGQDWAVLEINANPDIDLQRWPSDSNRLAVDTALVKHHFPTVARASKMAMDLCYAPGDGGESVMKKVQRKALELGIHGYGKCGQIEWSLHLVGTEAAIHYFVEWLGLIDPKMKFIRSKPSPPPVAEVQRGFSLEKA